MDSGGNSVKGLSSTVMPFLMSGGRVTIDTVLEYAMNSPLIDEEDEDFRTEVYKRDIKTIFTQNDFYSVGKGVFCHIDDMTEEERRNTATKLDSTGKRYIEKAEKIMDGQGFINPETMEIEFPEPIKING